MSTESGPMQLQDWTESELDTLSRIEAAPHAPEAYVRDFNPLVPTGALGRPWDIVPCPDLETGTAAQFSTYYLAQSQAAFRSVDNLIGPAFGAGPRVTALMDYTDAVSTAVHTFALGCLLRSVPDETARQLMGWLEMGDVAEELLHQWLTEAGVNPQHIRSLPSRSERVARYKEHQASRATAAQP